jgi:hypothetical protein
MTGKEGVQYFVNVSVKVRQFKECRLFGYRRSVSHHRDILLLPAKEHFISHFYNDQCPRLCRCSMIYAMSMTMNLYDSTF